jgi:hypothetical protein
VLWAAPRAHGPEPRSSDPACALVTPALDITEIRSDANYLYLDLVHDAKREQDSTHAAVRPRVGILHNGCPAPEPRFSGTVVEDWRTPSTISVDLASLPDGEVDVFVRLFGHHKKVAFLKAGKSIAHLRDDQRRGYQLLPGDPARGIPPSESIPDVVCSAEEVPL